MTTKPDIGDRDQANDVEKTWTNNEITQSGLSPLSMERVLERFRRRLCLRVFRAEHALLLKKNASTMNIAHVSMAQIAAPINVRANKVCYPTR